MALLRATEAARVSDLTAKAVERVLARQVELGLRQAIEWVDEVTPSLLPAVRGAAHEPHRYPLLRSRPTSRWWLTPEPEKAARRPAPRHRVRHGQGRLQWTGPGRAPRHRPQARAPSSRGRSLMSSRAEGSFAAPDRRPRWGRCRAHGDRGAARSPKPRPRQRHHPLARGCCRERGVDLVFLTAGSDAATRIYRRAGFRDIGTAYVLELDD